MTDRRETLHAARRRLQNVPGRGGREPHPAAHQHREAEVDQRLGERDRDAPPAAAGGVQGRGHVAVGERQAEGEPVVEHVHRDAGLEAAGEDDEGAGDQPEREAVEEDRDALAEPVREPEEERRDQHRHPGPVEEPADGLGEVAAEQVLLPRCLERREQHDHEQVVTGGRGERVRGAADVVGLPRYDGAHEQRRDERHDRDRPGRRPGSASGSAAGPTPATAAAGRAGPG